MDDTKMTKYSKIISSNFVSKYIYQKHDQQQPQQPQQQQQQAQQQLPLPPPLPSSPPHSANSIDSDYSSSSDSNLNDLESLQSSLSSNQSIQQQQQLYALMDSLPIQFMKIRGEMTKTTAVAASATTSIIPNGSATVSTLTTAATHQNQHHGHPSFYHNHPATTTTAAAAVAAAAVAAANSPSAFKYYTQFLNSIPHFSELKPAKPVRTRSSRCSNTGVQQQQQETHRNGVFTSPTKLNKNTIEANPASYAKKPPALPQQQIQQQQQLYGRISCSASSNRANNECAETNITKKLAGKY